LGEGNCLGINPEGTRSSDGKQYRGRTRIARLVLETAAPVVAAAIIGTDRHQPAGRLVPQLRRVRDVYGSPMDVSKYSCLPSDRLLLRSVNDEIMYESMRLSGQEYVDTYASTVKTNLLTSAKPKKTDSAREDAKDSAKKPKDSAPQGEGDAYRGDPAE